MNKLILTTMTIICVGCAPAPAFNGQHANIVGRKQSAVYVTTGRDGKYNGHAIKITSNSVTHAESYEFFKSGGSSDLGRIHYFIISRGDVYSNELPIFFSYNYDHEWYPKSFECKTAMSNAILRTNCVSKDGDIYESGFDITSGLQWLDFFCDSNVDVVCRYNLVGKQGVFARHRRSG